MWGKLNLQSLVAERDEWINHNFPGDSLRHSVMGMIEEAGELTHHYLKMEQRVRGREKYHLSEIRDAIGDITIFSLGVFSYALRYHGYLIRDMGTAANEPPLRTKDITVFMVSAYTGKISEKVCWGVIPLHEVCNYTIAVLHLLRDLSLQFSWDYDEIVTATWNEVKKRDWIRYPDTGLPPRKTLITSSDHGGAGTVGQGGFDPSY